MSKIVLALILLLAVALVGGGVYLAFFDIPAPTTPTKIVLPDARFPQ
jgi:hypothetical protein